jgi:hypothetical protein
MVFVREAAEVLGVTYEQSTQVAMIRIAYTVGTEFKATPRKDVAQFIHRNRWQG